MRKKKWKKKTFFLFFLFVLFFVFCFTHSLDSAVEVENALGRFGDKVLEAEEGLLVLHVSRNLVADLVAHSLSLAAHCFVSLFLSLSRLFAFSCPSSPLFFRDRDTPSRKEK